MMAILTLPSQLSPFPTATRRPVSRHATTQSLQEITSLARQFAGHGWPADNDNHTHSTAPPAPGPTPTAASPRPSHKPRVATTGASASTTTDVRCPHDTTAVVAAKMADVAPKARVVGGMRVGAPHTGVRKPSPAPEELATEPQNPIDLPLEEAQEIKVRHHHDHPKQLSKSSPKINHRPTPHHIQQPAQRGNFQHAG